jgi:YD repeat-containing protein
LTTGGILSCRISNWCVRPVGDPVVSVALPDGSVEKFRAKASPECQYLVPASEVELVFEPLAGTTSQLAQTRYGALRVVGSELVDLNDEGTAVDPDQYRLTLKDGTVYDLDQGFGLRKASDADGNSLTFTREGVTHSSGVGVRFIRDAAGRIIRMVLPDDSAIAYAYDAQGDLVSMTDQVGQTVRFGYLTGPHAHYLQDIVDPRGVRAARNEYDADGRLIAQIDADGRRIAYALDTAARTQRVTNRLGETTTYVFDDRGRVLQETNALGETVQRTYDVLGNTLSETNAEGETTRWVYDAAGNKVRETDHLGNVTVWSYDARGQVTSQTNANGEVTALNQYDSRSGRLTATTDGSGARTDLVYGFGGNLLELRQPEELTPPYVPERPDRVWSADFMVDARDETTPIEHRNQHAGISLDRESLRAQVVRRVRARAAMPAQSRAARRSSGTIQEPPTANTFASARYAAAFDASIPPVGQKRTRGNGPENAFRAAILPLASAGKNLKRVHPRSIPRITSLAVAIPGRKGRSQRRAAA